MSSPGFKPELKKQIVRSAAASGLGSALQMIIGLLITPYVLYRLGSEVFGTWVLLQALVGYVGLADLGFSYSYVKHIAECNTRGDVSGVNRIVSAGVFINTIVCVSLFLLIWPAAEPLLRLVRVEEALRSEAIDAFRIACVVLVVRLFVRICESLIVGAQRDDIASGIRLVGVIGTATGTIVMLESGFGLIGLVFAQVIGLCLETLLWVLVALKMYPTLRFDTGEWRELVPKLLRFGANIQVSRIATLVNFQFDKILINPVLGPTSVTVFEIGNRLSVAARTISMMPLAPLFPASSSINTSGTREDLNKLYTRATKTIMLFSAPMFLMLGVGAPWFIRAWVGPGYEFSAVILQILCVAHLLNVIAGPTIPIFEGVGRPDIRRRAEFYNLMLNVTLSVLLIFPFGIVGVAFGTLIAMAFTCVYYLRAYHALVEGKSLQMLKENLIGPIASGLLAALPAFAVAHYLDPFTPAGRIGTIVVIIGFCLTFLLTYAFVVIKTGVLQLNEIAAVLKHLPIVRGLLGRFEKTRP